MIEQLVGKRNIGLIPIASNIPAHVPSDDQLHQLRAEIANTNELIIAFFGMRDVMSSITAIQQMQSEDRKVKIMFIGKVPAYMQNLLPADCFKTGVLDTKDIYQYFLVSDIIVLPESTLSGCSFKSGSLAAAMGAGLPVVTAKGYLTDASMRDGENVVFTNFQNVAEVKTAIEKLVDSESRRKNIGEAAGRLLSSRTWEYTYEEYIKNINT